MGVSQNRDPLRLVSFCNPKKIVFEKLQGPLRQVFQAPKKCRMIGMARAAQRDVIFLGCWKATSCVPNEPPVQGHIGNPLRLSNESRELSDLFFLWEPTGQVRMSLFGWTTSWQAAFSELRGHTSGCLGWHKHPCSNNLPQVSQVSCKVGPFLCHGRFASSWTCDLGRL